MIKLESLKQFLILTSTTIQTIVTPIRVYIFHIGPWCTPRHTKPSSSAKQHVIMCTTLIIKINLKKFLRRSKLIYKKFGRKWQKKDRYNQYDTICTWSQSCVTAHRFQFTRVAIFDVELHF